MRTIYFPRKWRKNKVKSWLCDREFAVQGMFRVYYNKDSRLTADWSLVRKNRLIWTFVTE